MYTSGCASLIIGSSIIALVDGEPKYTKHGGHKGDEFKFNSAEKWYIYKFYYSTSPVEIITI